MMSTTDAFDLSSKGAIVTGSSRGIGRAIAESLARCGANVVITSRDQASCEEVARIVNARTEGRAHAIAAHIGSKEALKHLVMRSQEVLGTIDILVCNAASNPHTGPLASISDSQFEKTLHNNLLSTHWLIQLVAPAMTRRHDGAILLVASIGGFRGSAQIGAYNVSKAASMQLARNLAVELGPSGIRVNCIAPGLIRTSFARALWEDETNRAAFIRMTPLGRIGEPDDVGDAGAFLCSPAARYITGQSLIIDGGVTITSPGI
jgi:NAD(P)-dependent dehydrogenase (short-subunit alcohol dehydrogenase family)